MTHWPFCVLKAKSHYEMKEHENVLTLKLVYWNVKAIELSHLARYLAEINSGNYRT